MGHDGHVALESANHSDCHEAVEETDETRLTGSDKHCLDIPLVSDAASSFRTYEKNGRFLKAPSYNATNLFNNPDNWVSGVLSHCKASQHRLKSPCLTARQTIVLLL